jgi:hypothetical protein
MYRFRRKLKKDPARGGSMQPLSPKQNGKHRGKHRDTHRNPSSGRRMTRNQNKVLTNTAMTTIINTKITSPAVTHSFNRD